MKQSPKKSLIAHYLTEAVDALPIYRTPEIIIKFIEDELNDN